MDNLDTLTTQGTQDEEKEHKYVLGNTIIRKQTQIT